MPCAADMSSIVKMRSTFSQHLPPLRRCHAHADVILHVGGSGDGIPAPRGMHQRLYFGGHRCRRILQDCGESRSSATRGGQERQRSRIRGFIGQAHDAALGDVADFGSRDGEIIEGNRQRLAVKICT